MCGKSPIALLELWDIGKSDAKVLFAKIPPGGQRAIINECCGVVCPAFNRVECCIGQKPGDNDGKFPRGYIVPVSVHLCANCVELLVS
jgi:hypothetical protein